MKRNSENRTNGGVEVMAASPTSDPEVAPSTGDPDSPESAKLHRALDGEMVTVAVVFSGDDLRRLGINPNKTDAVRPRIQSGVVLIEAL
jgi:hypothetical protein